MDFFNGASRIVAEIISEGDCKPIPIAVRFIATIFAEKFAFENNLVVVTDSHMVDGTITTGRKVGA